MQKNLSPLKIIDNGDLATSLTSSVVDGRFLQQLKFLLSYTTVSAVGTFSLQESMDYNPVYRTGTWYDNGSGISAAASASNSAIVNLSNRGPCFYRLVYTRTSGDGFLTVWASGAGY